MTHHNNIDSIKISEQRAIKIWYTCTLFIIAIIIVGLTSITTLQIYYAITVSKICKPCVNIYNTVIKKKYDVLVTELKKAEQCISLKNKGVQLLTHYNSILSTHAHNTMLSPIITLSLKPTGLTAEYMLQSPQMINTYLDTLQATSLFKELFFSSCSQQSSGSYICTIQAEWVK